MPNISNLRMFYRNTDEEIWCGIGVENAKHMLNTAVLFRTVVSMGLAQFLFTIGTPYQRDLHADTCDSFKCMPVWNFTNFWDLHKRKPLACTLVGIELDVRAKSIETFKHPKRAIYILGGETSGLSDTAKQSCDYLIKLPSPRGFSANLSSTGSIVMWDRYVKLMKDNKEIK